MTAFFNCYRMEGRKVLPCRDEKELKEALENRWGVKTKVGEDTVSTVFLAVDYGFLDGPPLVFETMVFPECDVCVRYSTLKEAIAGHNRMVEKLRSKAWGNTAGQRSQRRLGGKILRWRGRQRRRLRASAMRQ